MALKTLQELKWLKAAAEKYQSRSGYTCLHIESQYNKLSGVSTHRLELYEVPQVLAWLRFARKYLKLPAGTPIKPGDFGAKDDHARNAKRHEVMEAFAKSLAYKIHKLEKAKVRNGVHSI